MSMLQVVEITGKEFIRKALAGERGFSRTKFVGEPLAPQDMEEINSYLKRLDQEGVLRQEPIILDLADLSGVEIPVIHSPYPNIEPVSIYAPHTKARGIRAVRANIAWAVLDDADLGPYEHPNHSFTRSDLRYCIADHAKMRRSIIKGARVAGVRFLNLDLSYADMKDLEDLERAKYVSSGIFTGALVSPRDDEIIRRQPTYRVAGNTR